VDTTKEYIRHLSLCSGYEGIGIGLRRVYPNVREVAHVEIEAFAIANLVAKMEENKISPAPIWTDLKTFPYEKFLGKVDCLSAGFPCPPFSQAGKREGVKDPRHLYPYISDGIGRCRPRLVFLENVEGIISSKTETGRSVLLHVLQDLESMGYIAEAGVFSASEVGAPHQRKRVFILGHSSSERSHRRSENRFRESSEMFGKRSKDAGGETKEVADSSSARTKIRVSESEQRQERDSEKFNYNSDRKWPSRPGEPQHDWEEPRTTPKPQLGGATNGASSRVDRLRLLGNGVVPQTVEVAFRTLSKRIEERIKLI
jgi:DNA (cytosine-5)-methyltransferase 1